MDKDAINFNNIANLNYSSNKSDNEKRFILEDEEEELPKINKIKITFNEALQKMKKNFLIIILYKIIKIIKYH